MLYSYQVFSPADGDITLAWTEDQVDMMTEIIGRKMQEGFSFFFIAEDGREVRLRQIDDLAGRNAVTIGDKEAEQLIRQGKIGIVDVSAMIDEADAGAPVVTTGRAKSARAAATGRTVATTPKSGG
jgi:hypothetical protein